MVSIGAIAPAARNCWSARVLRTLRIRMYVAIPIPALATIKNAERIWRNSRRS
jgi:hypothetical protein